MFKTERSYFFRSCSKFHEKNGKKKIVRKTWQNVSVLYNSSISREKLGKMRVYEVIEHEKVRKESSAQQYKSVGR